MIRLTDPTAVGDSIEVLNMDVINLNPEGFEYKHTSVPLDECCLIYQRTNTAMRTHSRVHADFESCWILGPQARGNLDGKKGVFVIPEGHEVWYPARQETQELFELGTRIAEAAENSPEIFNDNLLGQIRCPSRIHGYVTSKLSAAPQTSSSSRRAAQGKT